MAKVRDFLHAPAYKNYRNVRAAAVMFVLLGSMLVFAGVGLLTVLEPPPGQDPPPKLLAVLLIVLGLTGAVGGVATFRASPRWSKLAYVMASLYVLAFPLGTILSVVLFIGLGRYLADMARFRAAASGNVRPPIA